MIRLKNMYSGRLNRRNNIIGILLISSPYLILLFLLLLVLLIPATKALLLPTLTFTHLRIIDIPYILIVIPLFLSFLIRRIHDIGYSGWWILLLFLPFIGFIVTTLICVLPGTKGPNKYGMPSFPDIKFPDDLLGRRIMPLAQEALLINQQAQAKPSWIDKQIDNIQLSAQLSALRKTNPIFNVIVIILYLIILFFGSMQIIPLR